MRGGLATHAAGASTRGSSRDGADRPESAGKSPVSVRFRASPRKRKTRQPRDRDGSARRRSGARRHRRHLRGKRRDQRSRSVGDGGGAQQTVVGAARHQPERACDSLRRPRRRQRQRLQPRLLAPRRDGREHVRLRASDAAPDARQTREEPRAVDVEDGVFPRGSRRAAAAEISNPASQPRDDGRRPELNLDGPDGLHGRPVRPDDDARGDEPRRRERDGAVDRVKTGRGRRREAAADDVRKDASSGAVGEPRG